MEGGRIASRTYLRLRELLDLPQAMDKLRNAWNGWSEIESEPVKTHPPPSSDTQDELQAVLNSMLRLMGIHNVALDELMGLDDEALQWISLVNLLALFNKSP